MALFSNLKKDISAKYKQVFANKYGPFGFTWAEVKKTRAIEGSEIHTQSLLSKTLYFRNGNEVLHGIDEIFIEEVYKINLPEGALIIDCGAHIGLSVIYLKTHHPTAKVIAFEPDTTNFGLLQNNIQSFGFTNVQLRNEAVWKENKELLFASEGNMSSKISDATAMGKTRTTVTATRLANLLTEPVHFLKLDIEGAEYEVLNDCRGVLQNVHNLFIEYHGLFSTNHQLNEILSLVTESGFVYYIKEANPVYPTPFAREKNPFPYDLQLNIFCFRN